MGDFLAPLLRCVSAVVVGVFIGASVAGANDPAPAAPAAATPESPSFEAPTGALTIADIERRRAELEDATGLSTESRAEVDEQYVKAIERLESAADLNATAEAFKSEAERAPEELLRLSKSPAPAIVEEAIPDDDDLLRSVHREAEDSATEARRRLTAVTAEIERRTVRSRELPALVDDIRSRLDSIAESLAAAPAAGEPSVLVAARRLRLECARQHRQAELAALEQEGRTYIATSRVLALQRESAERLAAETGRRATALGRTVADRDQRAAEARTEKARQAAIMAHPAVREAASVNTLLAEEHAALLEAGKGAKLELERVETLRSRLDQHYAETRERAKEARFSPAIGLLLRSQQVELPDTSEYRRQIAEREAQQADINFKLLQWETERRHLGHADDTVAIHLDAVRDELGYSEQLDVREELETVLSGRLTLYADLITEARGQLGLLAALQSAEEGLVRVVDEQRNFIAEHVLWVRSTSPLSPAVLSLVPSATLHIVNTAGWSRIGRALIDDVRDRPTLALAWIPLLWLIAARRRLAGRLPALAEAAQRSTATGFRPTLEAIAVSAGMALPGPAIMALCGWQLTTINGVGSSPPAMGAALLAGAAAFLAINLSSAVCLPKGLGPAHFAWDTAAITAIRRGLGFVRWTCLPAGIIVMFSESTGDELLIGTLGRLALLTACGALASVTWQLFRFQGPVSAALSRQNPSAWVQVATRTVAWLLTVFPVAVAGLSLAGYHYTAVQLAARLVATWWLLGLSLTIRGLVLRWLTLVSRQLARRRASERRAEIATRQESAAAEFPVAGACSLELGLADVQEQSRRLIRMAVTIATFACLAFIWRDIVPAVGYLERFTLWHGGVVAGSESGELVRITLVEAILAGILATVTVLACRNLPGLLDLAVFQRLPLDAGARYAATAVTQYVVAVTGAMLCFRQIGIGWQSVQWLVAAMTVGLGFGLQEIFANFVSGIIILFERPIRVGDVVTIGDITGTVTRIRIRATTICDWDHKELIVPNREFVTGKLINWTLTNPTLRVVIRVGIAYGSDTRLATRLLEQVAATQPLVLADPPPTVVFTQFGESSLDFELRVFTTGVINTRVVRHELHVAIDDSFRTHGIDIAFPQRELHVKGLPAHWHDHPGDLQSTVPSEGGLGAGDRRVA